MRLRGFLAVFSFGLMASTQLMAQPVRVPVATTASFPDWSGVWSPGVTGESRRQQSKPVLTPAGQKLLAEFEDGKKRGENLQTDGANCIPSGMPGIMRLPYPIEFIIQPQRTTILIETYSAVRRIYTDGRKLPEDPDLWFNGHSVGRWEGDTLVINTVGISPQVTLTEGIKATEKTVMKERIRRLSDTILQDEITITDPTLFAEPFVITQKYTRKPDWEMREYICEENNKDAADPFGRPLMKLDE